MATGYLHRDPHRPGLDIMPLRVPAQGCPEVRRDPGVGDLDPVAEPVALSIDLSLGATTATDQECSSGKRRAGERDRAAGSADGMKRLASRSTWWHTLPHKSTHAVNAAGGEASYEPYRHGRPQDGKCAASLSASPPGSGLGPGRGS